MGAHRGRKQKVWIKKYLAELLGLGQETVQDKWAFFGYDPYMIRKYLIDNGYRVPRPKVADRNAAPIGQDPISFRKVRRGPIGGPRDELGRFVSRKSLFGP